MQKKILKGWSLAALVVLGGCSSIEEVRRPMEPQPIPPPPEPVKVEKADGPPADDIDVTHIPNAVPKIEPLSRYGNPPVYEVFGKRYKVMDKDKSQGYTAKGVASWYGRKFHGQRTSSGEPYDMFSMTAAHRSLPIPTYAKVKNLNNGKEVVVKINDRGPFVGDRLIDLSYAAAKKLGFHNDGTAKVHITAIDPIAWHKEQNGTALAASEPAKKTTLAASDKLDTKQIYVQIGAFNKKLSADELASQAAKLTKESSQIAVRIQPEKIANQSLYKVQLGPFKNKEEAQKLQKQFVALGTNTKSSLVYY
jgi:rare lipoprotein A